MTNITLSYVTVFNGESKNRYGCVYNVLGSGVWLPVANQIPGVACAALDTPLVHSFHQTRLISYTFTCAVIRRAGDPTTPEPSVFPGCAGAARVTVQRCSDQRLYIAI